MTWRELALNRGPFRRLWLGDAVSLFGDWFSYVAVGVLALGSDASGGELLAVAVVLVAHSLPLAVLAPLAGRFADRYDRRAIMVGASLLRGLAVLGMITAALAGSLAWVSGLLFVRMAFGAFIDPAANASLQQLVPRSQLSRANALLSATWSCVFAIGVAVGGLFTAAFGPVWALAVDGLTFMLAALILATLPRLRPGESVVPRLGDDQTAPVETKPEAEDRGADMGGPKLAGLPEELGGMAEGDCEVGNRSKKPGVVGMGGTGLREEPGGMTDGDCEGENQGEKTEVEDPSGVDMRGLGPGLVSALRFTWHNRPIFQAALGKMPVAFANGGGWVLLHHAAAVGGAEVGGTAVALGVLHSARALGTGVGPIVWARSSVLGATATGLHASIGFSLLAVVAFVLAPTPVLAVAACVLW
ncbi:MAG: MFS transporter, partial [Nannocystaceae bacterium]